ncbi:MAG TPA: biopolymer transporter ExbD [Polyangium sp.]|nr:biopolymer transporter ExbD [Polyangium sp.]
MFVSRFDSLASCALLFALSATVVGCGESKSSGGPTAAASTAPSAAAAKEPAPPPKPKGVPALIVDSLGPYLGITRIDVKAENWREKMAAVIKDFPIKPEEPVTVVAEKRAATPYVAALVDELGKAGATKIILKTDGRDDVPKQLDVVPANKVTSPPPCSVTVSVLKDLSTAVWPIKGATAKKQRKGLAGPDLSNTAETIKRDLAGCDSSYAFFSSDDAIGWEMAYNLAGTLKVVDEKSDKKRIETLVLLPEAPVAGRAVVLGK